jgi:spermidine/putrescine transport system substrate-binding protein
MTRRNALLSMCGMAAAGTALVNLAGNARAASRRIVWGTNDAYAQPQLLDPFISSSSISVETQLFSDPSEAVTKLQTGGAGIDVLMDGSYRAQMTYEAGVLQPIDETSIPNFSSIIPELRDADGLIFEGKRYGIPLGWGTDSVVYRGKEVGGVIDDIGVLFDKQFAGRIGMPNGLFESLIVAALYLKIPDPFAMNDDELNAVVDLLRQQKPMVRSYWNDIGDLKNQMATGEVVVAWGWAPVLDIRRDGVDVQWAHPKQGELAWYDASFITREAEGDALADSLALISYTLGDFYGVQLGKDVGYRTASNLAISKMDNELRTQLSLDDAASFLKNPLWWVTPREPDRYQKAWESVLNS